MNDAADQVTELPHIQYKSIEPFYEYVAETLTYVQHNDDTWFICIVFNRMRAHIVKDYIMSHFPLKFLSIDGQKTPW